jgi:hypothetical protein
LIDFFGKYLKKSIRDKHGKILADGSMVNETGSIVVLDKAINVKRQYD